MKTTHHSSKDDSCKEKTVVLISVAAALGLPYGSVCSHSPSHGTSHIVHAHRRAPVQEAQHSALLKASQPF